MADGPSPRRTIALVLVVAALAVLLRSFVYLRFEQLAFDSDQAITGLMAKHLVERRAFPLFFYGQTYMLAVEAWAAAPSVLLFGPTVTALRLSLLAWNLAFAFMLVTTLVRESRLSPWLALAPATFFLLAPASVASQLMWAQGGIVEPYVYVGALWLLRKRPIWFGALLAVGFRNREFVAYAVPALVVVESLSAQLTANRVRDWLISGVVFAAIWQLVEALKPFADLMGPGTRGQPPPGFLGSQFQNLVDRFDFGFAAAPGRVVSIGPAILAWFSGAGQVDSTLPVSAHPWMTAAATLSVVFAIVRLGMVIVQSGAAAANRQQWWSAVAASVRRAGFPLYLAIVGALAILFFVVGKPVLPGYSRYVLLGIVFPIGLSGALLALEPLLVVRRTVTALLLGWSLLSAADHVSVAAAYSRRPEPNAMRAVADQLVAEGVHVASAGYWRAYVITFFSRERLHVASQELPRIQLYQDEFLERRNDAVLISDYPCAGGRMIEDLYVCKP